MSDETQKLIAKVIAQPEWAALTKREQRVIELRHDAEGRLIRSAKAVALHGDIRRLEGDLDKPMHPTRIYQIKAKALRKLRYKLIQDGKV